jgi:chaperone required for assembly of F1-ATPase
MKRFWKVAEAEGGQVLLDGRPVRTPRRNLLTLPTPALATAIAAEWDGVGEELDPRTLRLTGLANAAIDIVAPDPAPFAASLAQYGETDLLAYRAESPEPLIARQAAEWDPLLAWARHRYDVHVEVVAGIMHRPQPALTVTRLAEAIAARTPFELAALSPIVTIGGSLIAALALAERAFAAETLWRAVNLDTLWQEEQWGEDPFAAKARASHRAEWDAAVRFLELLPPAHPE